MAALEKKKPKQEKKKKLPRVTDCVCVCMVACVMLFNHPSSSSSVCIPSPFLQHQLSPLTVMNFDFDTSSPPHTVTVRRLVCDRAGEITAQHMGLYDGTVSIQNTFTLMESMAHQVGCGSQHLKAINSQASNESLMTTC